MMTDDDHDLLDSIHEMLEKDGDHIDAGKQVCTYDDIMNHDS